MSDLIERLEARADIEEHGAAISSDEPISALLREAIAALRAQLGVAEDELASLRAQIAQPADMEKAVAAADATEWDGDVFIGSTMTAKITAALPFLRWAASDRELLIRVRDWMSDNIRERDIEGASILGEVASLIATLKPVGNADATGEGKVAVAWRYRSPWIRPAQGLVPQQTGYGPWHYTADRATVEGRKSAGDDVQPLYASPFIHPRRHRGFEGRTTSLGARVLANRRDFGV